MTPNLQRVFVLIGLCKKDFIRSAENDATLEMWTNIMNIVTIYELMV